MMKLLAALGLLALALTAPLAQARALQQTATPPPTCNVNYGAFGQSVAFIVVSISWQLSVRGHDPATTRTWLQQSGTPSR
jgi:hypothetical protein